MTDDALVGSAVLTMLTSPVKGTFLGGVGDINSRLRRPSAQVKSRLCGHATCAGRAPNLA